FFNIHGNRQAVDVMVTLFVECHYLITNSGDNFFSRNLLSIEIVVYFWHCAFSYSSARLPSSCTGA
ncbi:MAG: hypothetical protein WCK54_19230, partial [Desulfuromonadales bacterium]